MPSSVVLIPVKHCARYDVGRRAPTSLVAASRNTNPFHRGKYLRPHRQRDDLVSGERSRSLTRAHPELVQERASAGIQRTPDPFIIQEFAQAASDGRLIVT